MERDGLVQRRMNPRSKRRSLFELTRQARAPVARAREALLAGERVAALRLDTGERARRSRRLRRVCANMDGATQGVAAAAGG